MKRSGMLITVFFFTLFTVACEKKETPAEHAVDKTKDALDIREHEKLKDAGEDAKDAMKDAGDAVKDETHRD